MVRPLLPFLLLAALHARPFDPSKDIAMTVAGGQLVVDIPAGAHLKCRTFRVTLPPGQGRLAVGPLPASQGRDEAGDAVWRGRIRVPLHAQGLDGRVTLRITFQPCTEGPEAVCFLPQHRTLVVDASASGLR